jgi:N-formylmethionyl-tRNA deformylase
MEEGCLSIPEQFAEIERPKIIKLQYLDDHNKLIEREVDGVEARILQHEIDHLSGKLFVDYLSHLKRNIMIKKVQKYLKIKNNA